MKQSSIIQFASETSLTRDIVPRVSLAMERTLRAGFAVIPGAFRLRVIYISPFPNAIEFDSFGKYVVVKVSTSLRKFPTATHRELKVYQHLARVESVHPGQSSIRELYDAFELDGSEGKHQCLVQQPMHMTLLEMMRLNPEPFNLPLLKMTLRRILSALDFLHTEAQVGRTGMQHCVP